MDSRSYLVGDSRITLIFGDITASRAQVIVSSDDYLLTMGGGVSHAIHHAAGPEIRADARKLTPLKLADVAVSTAGDLPAKYVMHAVTIGSFAEELTPDAVVRQTTQRALRLATSLGCSSIAFPAIGSGTARIPFEIVTSQMAGALVDYLLEADPPLDVELYLMEKHRGTWQSDLWPFFETFAGRTRALETSRSPEGAVLSPPTGESETCDGDSVADADTQRRRQVFEMLRHLDARRDALEAALLGALQGDVPGGAGTVSHIRKQLDEIKALRSGYEEELERISQPVAPVVGDSVFVSSTAVDLREHRDAVRSAIDELRLKFIGMEEFAPNAQAPADFIRAKVDSAQVYVGILGMRYGSVDEATGLSMTELEYRQARTSGKDLLMYVMGDEALVKVGSVESDPERFAKLQEFRGRVLTDHTCGMFNDVDQLVTKAQAGLKGIFPR